MPIEQEQRYCKFCDQPRLCTRPGVNHLIHALVSLFLCGFWIPVWIFIAIAHAGTPYRCTVCGQETRL